MIGDKKMVSSFLIQMEESRNPENAAAMKKYMKNLFPFLGIKASERKKLSKTFIQELCAIKDFESYVLNLWELPEREYQYVAVDFLVKKKKLLDESHVDLIESLILTKSWWDTVDPIASHLVGAIFSKSPALVQRRGTDWVNSENIWLQRSMILFQLKYKEKADKELLFSIIERTKHIEEFFIQKAIGWALREYSKTNPADVGRFIESQSLSNLARKEGLKHIEKVIL